MDKEIKEYIDKELKKITDDLVRELIEIKKLTYELTFRLDALVRSQIDNGKSYDDILQSLDNHREYSKKIDECKAIPVIRDKINFVLEANKKLKYKIYADDLGLINQIESFGGVLPEIAILILTLPCSEKFQKYMMKYLPNDKDNS